MTLRIVAIAVVLLFFIIVGLSLAVMAHRESEAEEDE